MTQNPWRFACCGTFTGVLEPGRERAEAPKQKKSDTRLTNVYSAHGS